MKTHCVPPGPAHPPSISLSLVLFLIFFFLPLPSFSQISILVSEVCLADRVSVCGFSFDQGPIQNGDRWRNSWRGGVWSKKGGEKNTFKSTFVFIVE